MGVQNKLCSHGEGRRKSEIVVCVSGKEKQSLVVRKLFIFPPTPHSPVYSVGGRTLTVCVTLAECWGFLSIFRISASAVRTSESPGLWLFELISTDNLAGGNTGSYQAFTQIL